MPDIRESTAFRHGALFVIAVALLAVTGAGTSAQTNWRRIDTPNFVAIGDVSASVLRDVVQKFESFRATLGRLHGARLVGSPVPTIIIVFPSDTAIAPFRPKFNGKPVDVAGLMVPGREVNYIAVVNDDNKAREQIVFHEYAHLVARNGSQPLPVWLNEGIAEYYSTFESLRNGRDAIVGNVVSHHIAQLNDTVLIPIAELLKIDHGSSLYNEGSRRSVFYAQSWALVHMILRAEPSRAQQLAAYVDGVWRGVDPLTAWQEAFGAVNMDQELDRYIRRQSFTAVKYSFGEAVATLEGAQATPMTPSDVQAFLADFQTELDDYDGAAARLAELAKRDPSNARAIVTAARLSEMRGQPGDTGERLRTMTPPSDWLLAYLAGVTLADKITDGTRPAAADVQAVERFLEVARKGGREFPNAVARVAALELRAEATPSAETEAALDRARQLAPGRYDYTFLHAQILVRRKEFAKARALLGTLLATGPPSARETTRSLLGTVAEFENALSANSSSVVPPMTAAGSAPPLPSGSREPAAPTFSLRTMKPGEQRLEAMFENIECVVGKGITFHFKMGAQAVTATAQKFDEVEFITYRSDLSGSISCGPLKEPMKVLLTWRPGPTDGSKLAVALEFLPKGK